MRKYASGHFVVIAGLSSHVRTAATSGQRTGRKLKQTVKLLMDGALLRPPQLKIVQWVDN